MTTARPRAHSLGCHCRECLAARWQPYMVAISAGIAGVMPAPTAASLADRLLAPGVLPEALRLPLADYRDRIEAALGGRS